MISLRRFSRTLRILPASKLSWKTRMRWTLIELVRWETSTEPEKYLKLCLSGKKNSSERDCYHWWIWLQIHTNWLGWPPSWTWSGRRVRHRVRNKADPQVMGGHLVGEIDQHQRYLMPGGRGGATASFNFSSVCLPSGWMGVATQWNWSSPDTQGKLPILHLKIIKFRTYFGRAVQMRVKWTTKSCSQIQSSYMKKMEQKFSSFIAFASQRTQKSPKEPKAPKTCADIELCSTFASNTPAPSNW